MNEHLTKRQMDDFRARKLSPSELFALGEHLAGCAACRAELEFSDAFAGRAGFLKSEFANAGRFPEHLSFEQLSEFVDNRLNEFDRELVESHLSICPVCEREAIELRAFAASLEPSAPLAVAPSSEPAFREKIRAFIFTPAFGAAFGAFILLAAFGGYLLFREDPARPVVENKPPPIPSNANQDPPPSETLVAADPAGNSNRKLSADPELAENKKPPSFNEQVENELLRSGLKNGRLETPRELRELFARTGNLMGGQFIGGVPFRIETPTRTVIDETRPLLRWRALAGADEYRVGVYDENFNEVAGGRGKANQLRLSKPLKRGAVYRWEVEALKDGKPIGSAPARTDAEAKFKILESGKSAQMQKELNKNPRSALWKGVVYARFGLLTEAERELIRYSVQNPGSKPARDLVNQIRALRK
jgi:hypothetical protein